MPWWEAAEDALSRNPAAAPLTVELHLPAARSGSGKTAQLTLRAGRIRDRAEPSAAAVGSRAAPATDSGMWERANEEIEMVERVAAEAGLRSILLKLDRIKGVSEHVKRSLRFLKSFVGAVKVRVEGVEFAIDIDGEPGVADSGTLSRESTESKRLNWEARLSQERV